jgi:NodT family efflux transporter outer membrane factor (OMF) lipoprotein
MKHKAIHSGAVALVAAALLASGCANRRTVYRPPAAPQLAQAETWNTTPAGGATAKPADDETLSRWWSTLRDPVLTSLEERAVKANLDVRRAGTKIRQSQSNRESARADLLPGYSVTGSGTGNRTSTRSGGDLGQSYSTSMNASWEPDFFNKLKGSVAAYEADIQAAQEDLRTTLVSLTAEVALDYVDVRSYQSQLAVTTENLARYQDTYEMTVAKFESGLSTALDVEQAHQTVESTRAGIPTLEANIQKSSNAIAVLLGERPGAVDWELAEVKPVPAIPAEVAVGIPADLVRRRPDIRAAERQFAAQSARVGVAQANLYPSLSLSGTFNFGARDILNLLTPATLASSLAGSVQNTILNRRKLREQVNIQNIALEQSAISYESTVLGAIQDVEDALRAFGAEQVRRKSLAEAAHAAGNAADMSRELYAAGLKDFLTVLDSERSILSLQNSLAQSDANITANLIRLYKAMGGGWK